MNVEIDNTTIEILSTKLKHLVTPLDIVKWLNNFADDEIEMAVTLLSNLTVYTTYEIEEILESAFVSLFSEKIANGTKIIVNAVGDFGKSGSMIAYFFQKTSFYKSPANKGRITIIDNLKDVEFDDVSKYSVVLLDDFVGSGNTIEKYYLKNAAYLTGLETFFIGIAGLRKGVRYIQQFFTKVVIPPSNLFQKAFSHEASYFGYRKFHRYRNLCYKYGVHLSPKLEKVGKISKYTEALGYENSQALVAFAYGSPNNTLPIIWANRTGWFPIFPRFTPDKVSAARKLRKEISYELSILKEFGSSNLKDNFFFKVKRGKKIFTSVSSLDFSLYGIIKLSRAGFLPENICQKLGILQRDYDEYLQSGKEKGIFEDGNSLSLFGLKLYQDAKKCIAINKKKLLLNSKETFEIRAIKYMPNQFNGRS
jgi:hypothetical protein